MIFDPTTQTPQQWRAQATESQERRWASEENSGADGFLSQAASDAMSLLYGLCAKVAEQDGYWEFEEPVALDGTILNARQVQTRYGLRWVWTDSNGESVWFSESNAASAKTRARNNAKKGVQMALVRRRAAVETAGFSGGRIVPLRRSEEAPVFVGPVPDVD